MVKNVILDTEHFTLWYYPTPKIVHHQFHSYIYGNEFRSCLNEGTKLMEKYGAEKWLSDDRRNSALPFEDLEWGLMDWQPRALAAGWKYWAILVPERITGQMNMKTIAEQARSVGLVTEMFVDPETALTWLKSL